MSDMIYHLDLRFDKKILLREMPETKTFSKLNPSWRKTYQMGEYGRSIKNKFSKMFDGNIRTSYHHQPKNTIILNHKDTSCKCSINFKLTDDTLGIMLDGNEFFYNCALINVSKYSHGVKQTNTDRILFRIIFDNDEFDTVLRKLK